MGINHLCFLVEKAGLKGPGKKLIKLIKKNSIKAYIDDKQIPLIRQVNKHSSVSLSTTKIKSGLSIVLDEDADYQIFEEYNLYPGENLIIFNLDDITPLEDINHPYSIEGITKVAGGLAAVYINGQWLGSLSSVGLEPGEEYVIMLATSSTLVTTSA